MPAPRAANRLHRALALRMNSTSRGKSVAGTRRPQGTTRHRGLSDEERCRSLSLPSFNRVLQGLSELRGSGGWEPFEPCLCEPVILRCRGFSDGLFSRCRWEGYMARQKGQAEQGAFPSAARMFLAPIMTQAAIRPENPVPVVPRASAGSFRDAFLSVSTRTLHLFQSDIDVRAVSQVGGRHHARARGSMNCSRSPCWQLTWVRTLPP